MGVQDCCGVRVSWSRRNTPKEELGLTMLRAPSLTKRPTLQSISKWWRRFMVTVGILQNVATGGVIFGWASISATMLPSDSKGPGLNISTIHSMFVLASSINFLSPLVLGVVLDRFGPRACSVLSIGSVALGFLVFGLATDTPQFVMGVALISFGGPGVQNAIIHLSNLFPRSKSTIISLITGSFQLSFSVFYFFGILWSKYNVGYKELFLTWSAVCTVAMLASIVLWPDEPFDFDSQLSMSSPATRMQFNTDRAKGVRGSTSIIRLPSVFRKSSAGGERQQLVSQAPPDANLSIKDLGLWDQVKSREFAFATAFLVVASFWANFYIGTIDLQLADEGYLSVDEQHKHARTFTLVTLFGVTGIPVAGHLMDVHGFVVTSLVTVTLGVLWSIGTLLQQEPALLFAFFAYTFFRTFTFNFYFAFVANKLGVRYFGILAGLSFFVSGLLSFLQQPLLLWGHLPCVEDPDNCNGGNWTAINWLQLVSLASLFAIPTLLHLDNRRKTQAISLGLRTYSYEMPQVRSDVSV